MQAPRIAQAIVLVGCGVQSYFAWILISIGFVVGLPTSTSTTDVGQIENPKLVITLVTPDSPAAQAVLKSGDVITAVSTDKESAKELTPESVSEFIGNHGENDISISYMLEVKRREASYLVLFLELLREKGRRYFNGYNWHTLTSNSWHFGKVQRQQLI